MKTVFKDISSHAFEHPADRAALVTLKQMTGFNMIIKKIVGLVGERRLRLMFLGNAVRVNEKQLPKIHNLLKEVCTTLDMKEVPELFVVPSPHFNASAIGVDKPFVVLNSATVENLSDIELKYVLGHEVGHIMAGHSLYKTVLMVLLRISHRIFGTQFLMLSLPILLGLKEWERKAELTGDRAGLLVIGDLEVSSKVIMKMAGATNIEQYNLSEFENQAKEYEEIGGIMDQAFKVLNLLWASHPFPVQRLLEIKKWANTPEYAEIKKGNYAKRSEDHLRSPKEDMAQGAVHYKEGIENAKDFFSDIFRDLGEGGKNVVDFLKKDRKKKTGND